MYRFCASFSQNLFLVQLNLEPGAVCFKFYPGIYKTGSFDADVPRAATEPVK